METLTKPEEQRMLDGVKAAVDLVDNHDTSPNDALEKVAREYSWTRGALRSAVSAFNNGRQVAQWRANENLLDKLADFPLADYDVIEQAIWGGTKQAADQVDLEYSFPPTFVRTPDRERLRATDLGPLLEKAAGDGNLPDREEELHPLVTEHRQKVAMERAYNKHLKAQRIFDEHRTKYALAHDMVQVYLRMLEGYFKKAAMDRLPFGVVEDAAITYHGAQGRALFDTLAKSFPREKRAADTRIFLEQPLSRDQVPFTWIVKAIDAARDVYRSKQAMDAAYEQAQIAKAALRPFAETPPSPHHDILSPSLIKDAGLFDAIGGAALKGVMDETLSGEKADKKVDKAWTELEDPGHDNELRKIRAQAMLSSMLSDPENPISGYNPEEVLSKYNDIADLAPRVAEHPAAVQPLIMQRLAGQTQPFEVKETVDMEKGLKETKNQTPLTRSLLDAPDTILG